MAARVPFARIVANQNVGAFVTPNSRDFTIYSLVFARVFHAVWKGLK